MTDHQNKQTIGARTLILHPHNKLKAPSLRSPEHRLEEAKSLVLAIELDVGGAFLVPLSRITPATYIGSGKVKEMADYVRANEITLTVMDCHLSPIQQRNLEQEMGCKVIDRTALILEIFGARARTKEGVLQVELAALEYQKSRLVRSWTHLERQRGGFGFTGGPGETQIEVDRRMIRDRIAKIKGELEVVSRTRSLHRKNREAVPYPVVALVGYTNAGKSTLFNRLTGENVFVKNLLFATLDPTMRFLALPSGNKVILSDTVGFISDLPTQLVAAFRATLEEVVEADLLLHVRDIASLDSDAQRQDVLHVLTELGLEEKIKTSLYEVWNKIDLLDEGQKQRGRGEQRIPVSAVTGEGIPELLAEIDRFISVGSRVITISVPAAEGKLVAWVFANGKNVVQNRKADTLKLTCLMTEEDIARFQKMSAGKAKITPK